MNMNKILLLLISIFTFSLSAKGQESFKESKFTSSATKTIDFHFNVNAFENLQERGETDNNLKLNTLKTSSLKGFSTNQYKVLQKDGNKPILIEGELSMDKRNPDLRIQAKSYFHDLHPILNTLGYQDEFRLIKEWKDEIGYTHLKYNQSINDIPVFGAEVILHAQEGSIKKMNGQYLQRTDFKDDLPTVASLSAADARDKVKPFLKSYREIIEDDLWLLKDQSQWQTELVYYKKEQQLKLAYYLTVYSNPAEWDTFFIDASTGEIIDTYTNICKFHHPGHDCSSPSSPPPDGPRTAIAQDLYDRNVTINTYEVNNGFYMIDGSRTMFSNSSDLPNDPVGAIWTIDAFNTAPQNSDFKYDHVFSNDNNWDQNESVSAHFNGGLAYEYYRDVHNRNSINGSGGNIISFVNISGEDGSSVGNAFWSGQAIFYGNGDQAFLPLGRALDVAGHEMTHGVIQNTANLEYSNESGAINESIADSFGAMIDREDWQIGEDVAKTSFFPSGSLRDMQNPHNGAPTGDFQRGWQPSHYSERYTGSQDNGGVHINSGIPNHAYYLFATQVGKAKAEQVYYRALSSYLTRSSKFVDLRAAVTQAAGDLYGTAEVNAANSAFDQVGVGQGSGGNYQQDNEANPGQDLVIFTDPDQSNIFLSDGEGNLLTTDGAPLSTTDIISKPSVTDDGSTIIFTGADQKLYVLNIDWSANSFSQEVFQDDPSWRNVIISKDGTRIAALSTANDNNIIVYDLIQQAQNDFTLYNPTFTEGVSTGDVRYADVMEFDPSGNFILYDAINEIQGANGSIEYWDIGLINVWNKSANTWALGEVQKVIAGLAEGVSIGNPTFSKNSPYIIAFDYIEASDRAILGMNIETQDIQQIFENNILGYPTYNNDDNKVLFDFNSSSYGEELAIINLSSNKISGQGDASFFFTTAAQPSQWGVWFSNGDRDLNASLHDEIEDPIQVNIFPNPVDDFVNIDLTQMKDKIKSIEITDAKGQMINKIRSPENRLIQVPIAEYNTGIYFLHFKTQSNSFTRAFVIK